MSRDVARVTHHERQQDTWRLRRVCFVVKVCFEPFSESTTKGGGCLNIIRQSVPKGRSIESKAVSKLLTGLVNRPITTFRLSVPKFVPDSTAEPVVCPPTVNVFHLIFSQKWLRQDFCIEGYKFWVKGLTLMWLSYCTTLAPLEHICQI